MRHSNSSFCIRHSSFVIRHSIFVILYSSFVIINPSSLAARGYMTDDDSEESGAITSIVNSSIASATGDANAPKLGAYFIGKYSYTNEDGKDGGDGFSQRFARAYVDGRVLKDFKYRVQVQINNDKFHMKDYFLEWSRWKEFAVKVGQFKRAFLFENPTNPWDVGFGDYSQVVRKLSGIGDRCGEAAVTGGRDQGLQIQGDLFPMGKEGYRLVHYQLQMMNGQGINCSDANGRKDFIGTLQVQPVKDLYVGVFGWTGNYVSNGVTVDRNRWAVSAKYEHNGWSARAEYAHSQGHKISEYNPTTNTFSGRGKADGWYATIGIPFNSWLKVYAKYDCYRDQATSASARTMYALIPNIRLHKNLLFQLQLNHIHDKTSADTNYQEAWAEVYVRF